MGVLDGVQWGSMGEWLVVLPITGGVLAYRQEHRRRRRQHAERMHVLPVGSYRFSKTEQSSLIKYALQNTGSDPVYDVRVDLLPWDWKTNPERLSGHSIAVFPAGTPRPTNDDLTELEAAALPPPAKGYDSAPIRLTFRDSTGITWRRQPDGTLLRQKRCGKWAREA